MMIEKLPSTYASILNALVELYMASKKPVKSRDIAEKLGINEGTVRNSMVALRAMGYIESKTGPYGGYVPTQKALEYVKMPTNTVFALDIAPITINKLPTNLYVTGIELLDVINPFSNRALVRVIGDMKNIRIGDNVRIGPTANSRVIIEGVITEKNEGLRELVVAINKLIAIPKVKVEALMSKNVITIRHDSPLKEAAKVFAERKIRALPVIDDEGRIVGLITTSEIAKAYYEGNLNVRVEDYARRDVPTIDKEADIYDAMRLMTVNKIGRLIVVSGGKPVGIITRTDILQYLASLD
ncbi:CBS domain-containing protein [Vulcanisaeta distributa]|uniref:Putative signal transduction protein with CBS domains n=1 Tax=Vulcanisaeta distributa (strain DSM 14429 / JCM 11212 / NBRC 100878 / IC-017) TaxID=572478 RepID=E1QV97_VULDI|nr:CBS domain-containing protein [Vulcanisaeta distributa]ADN50024.1 putative signal transduction protein with CBS domains [Vulcanisaeta distributa DSM 14429]